MDVFNYNGVQFSVKVRGNRKDIILVGNTVDSYYANCGADMEILLDIGSQNPHDVMEKFLQSF